MFECQGCGDKCDVNQFGYCYHCTYELQNNGYITRLTDNEEPMSSYYDFAGYAKQPQETEEQKEIREKLISDAAEHDPGEEYEQDNYRMQKGTEQDEFNAEHGFDHNWDEY